MKRFVSLVVVFMVCVACSALEPKEIAVIDLTMSFKTKTEQTHWIYGAGDFITNKDAADCKPLPVSHSVSISGGKLTVDAGTEYELSFKITSCSYEVGKVFADRGTIEVYRLVSQELDENIPSKWSSVITIQKVKDGARAKTIITIPKYDEYGVIYSISIFH